MTDLRLVAAETVPVREHVHLVENRDDQFTELLARQLLAPYESRVVERLIADRILEEQA